MAATTTVREIRRGCKAARKKAALVGAVAATATAMTVGVTVTPAAPVANALPDTLTTTTSGPLFWLINQLGVDSITIPDIPVLGSLTLDLGFTGADSVGLYDAINASKYGGVTSTRPNILAPAGTPTGPLVVASGRAVPSAIQAYEAMLASANGTTPAGYTPLTPGSKLFPNVTNLPLALLRNPGTPNGGLYARFAPILNLFGVDPVSPNADSGASTGLKLNSGLVNLALGYDAYSDFPATLNPLALANSVFASLLPTYLLGGGELKGADTDTIVNDLLALLTLGNSFTTYSTFAPNDLPLLEPLRLPSRLINAVFDAVGIPFHLGTPLANALQPAFKILVNAGYTDVITPDKLNDCATGCGVGETPMTYAELGYTAYDRSFLTSGEYTPFLSQAPLTPQEWLQVPGDVVRALIGGVTDEIKRIFGITSPPVSSVPASVSASLRGAPVAQAISPAVSPPSESPAAEKVATRTAPVRDTLTKGIRAHRAAAVPVRPRKVPEPATAVSASPTAGSRATSGSNAGSTHRVDRSAKPAA